MKLLAYRADHGENPGLDGVRQRVPRGDFTEASLTVRVRTIAKKVSLVGLWIAFNALYGRWDESRPEPRPEREYWRRFIDAILELDETGYVHSVLIEHKRPVLSLLDDEFLSCSLFGPPLRPDVHLPASSSWQRPG